MRKDMFIETGACIYIMYLNVQHKCKTVSMCNSVAYFESQKWNVTDWIWSNNLWHCKPTLY